MSVAFLLPFFPGFISFICAYGLETWKGTQEPLKKKKKETFQDIGMTFCVVKSLGFHSLSPQGCDKIFYQVFRR